MERQNDNKKFNFELKIQNKILNPSKSASFELWLVFKPEDRK